MKLKEFRANDGLVKASSKLWKDPVFQAVLEVLDSEHVMNKGTSQGLPTDDKLIRLGQIDGYNLCQSTIRSIFQEPPAPHFEPVARFGAPSPKIEKAKQ